MPVVLDRLSETAVEIGSAYGLAPGPGRIVIVSVALVGDVRRSKPGDRHLEMRWREIRAKLFDRQIANHLGQIVAGSTVGLVAEFRNAVNAVRCAIEMQRDIPAANSGNSELTPIELRIGIHASEDGASGRQAYAQAQRIASELEQFAQPGEILVSPAARALIAGAPDLVTEPAPSMERRHASGNEPAYRLALALPGAGAEQRRPHQSVAVLPFSNVDEPSGGYFTDGIVEDIVRALSATQDLIVVSRSSTLSFRDADVQTVGRQLAVRYVVTGTTRRSSKRLVIAAKLVDTVTGKTVWHRRYDVAIQGVFDLQRKIARRIASSLLPNLSSAELQRIKAKPPENLDAYDLVLQALHRMYRLRRQDFVVARGLIERAIKMEPGYATAYTYLAMWHMLNLGQGYCEDENREGAEMQRAAASALERDAGDAHALALLGHCKAWLYRDYDAALDLFEQAYVVSPNSAVVWGWGSPICSYLGDGAAGVTRAERALRLCPLGPHSYFFRAVLALGHYTLGNYDEAARWSRRSMAVYPHYEANLRFLAASLAASGRVQEARRVGRALLALRPDFQVNRFAARYAYRAAERNERFAEHLRLAGLPD